MIIPIIRIERGYGGNYLYKLQNIKDFDIPAPARWHFSYWTLNVNLIFDKLKELA